MSNFKPKDIIAVLIIAGAVILRIMNINHDFDAPIALILGYYFVKRQNGEDKGV